MYNIYSMATYLEFERPLEDLENKIEELMRLSDKTDIDIESEIANLQSKARGLCADIYGNLTRWQKTLIARHPDRPYTLDYLSMISDDFIELHGDRRFSDDKAVAGGICTIGGFSVMVVGHQKGRTLKERIARNFGQPHPEGYRKAMRLMKIAERFKLPVVALIDTPGAYPGIGAEERGQAEAIASNLLEMSLLKTPIISIVIGEGGSGGALALGVSDRLYMLEYSVYSVISPEGCAAILMGKEGGQLGVEDYARAADALKVSSSDLMQLGVIDAVIPEPLGGAHRTPKQAAQNIKDVLERDLADLLTRDINELLKERYERLRRVGKYVEAASEAVYKG